MTVTKGGNMPEPNEGCARVTGSVVGGSPEGHEGLEPDTSRREAAVSVHVGQKAPDFTSPAYHKGAFTSVQLSKLAGKWVLLCFYPGDFTFV
jgi:hypothetical protein